MSRVAELLARASYGRLLATLASRTRDIAQAEDALSEAFVAALQQWPHEGVPDSPDAWLLTTARRRVLDGHRRQAVRVRDEQAVGTLLEELADARSPHPLPDARLRLLFVCTHPAIDAAAQVPLMLQTVLGLDANAIAGAMRVAPKTMGQRLWRAKAKIRDAGIPFEVPEPDAWPARLEAVLEAVYAAYGTAWEDVRGMDVKLRGLADEAIFLGRLLTQLLPAEAEAHGLLALMLFAEARRDARRDSTGAYVPLDEQDQSRWDADQINEAEHHLDRAFALGKVGPLQLEAALQAAHVAGARAGRVDHRAILALHEGLLQLAPSLGAVVSHAAALLEAGGAAAALDTLDGLDQQLTREYQPYWAVRASALTRAGRHAESREAYQRAIGLTEDDATRRFLAARAAELGRHRP